MRKYFLEDKNRVRDSKPPVKGQVSLYQNGVEIFHGNNLVVDSGRRLLIDTIVKKDHFFLFYGEDSNATLPSYGTTFTTIPANVIPIDVPTTTSVADVQNWTESKCQATINGSDMTVTLTTLIYPNVDKPIVIREVGTFVVDYKDATNKELEPENLEKLTAFSRIVVDPIPLTSGDPIQVIYKLYF